MSHFTLRRSGAFLASVGLLASLAVATVAAPVSAGGCQAFTGSFESGVTCYYATEPININILPAGVTLNGADASNFIGQVDGTYNGGSETDLIESNTGTVNGGPGGDRVFTNAGTFNGGPGGDLADDNGYNATFDPIQATFNGGSGNDRVLNNSALGVFAGGGGSDCYNGPANGTIWSATPC